MSIPSVSIRLERIRFDGLQRPLRVEKVKKGGKIVYRLKRVRRLKRKYTFNLDRIMEQPTKWEWESWVRHIMYGVKYGHPPYIECR